MPVGVSPVPPAPGLHWSGGGGGGSSPGLQDYIQGLQMLGGVLALPRSVQYAQQDVLQKRAMLKDTGMTDAEINQLLPDAPMQWLSPGKPGEPTGIGGKILGGVGDVGALLSTIVGQPIGPPRASVSDLASASKLRLEYKKQQAYEDLAKDVTDPFERGLIRTGNLDAAGRVRAANLRNQPGDFGKSEMGMHARLAWLKANKPDSPEIPALEQAITDYEKSHPTPPPPLTPEQQRQEKLRTDAALAAQQHDRRVKNALDAGYKPGTDEYNRMVYGSTAAPPRQAGRRERTYEDYYTDAWKQEVERSQREFDEPDPARAKRNADAAWQTLHPPKPGAPGGEGGATLPPGAPPAAPPGAPPEKPTGEAPPAPPSPAEQQASARTKVMQLIRPPGGRGTPVAPAVIAQQYPDMWATAGLTGMEGTSPEDLATYLTPAAPGGPQTEARTRIQQLLVPPGGRGTAATPAAIAKQFPDVWAAAGLTGREGMTSEELRTYLGGEAPAKETPPTEETPPPSPSSLQGVQRQQLQARTRADLSPAAQAQYDAVLADVAAHRITLEEGRLKTTAILNAGK